MRALFISYTNKTIVVDREENIITGMYGWTVFGL